ncbi:hypothetical protein BDN72DRAFT_842356 [Pluteus cervinus]|uniref:Uncharacterized protein n=1 Tax=Pluteus cervinus TaxID=181527 RepID=A0ACD3AST0_9AGAR|nr:hypothetical protein BDN72DRAFT_842356 [Pluteus cervinus]
MFIPQSLQGHRPSRSSSSISLCKSSTTLTTITFGKTTRFIQCRHDAYYLLVPSAYAFPFKFRLPDPSYRIIFGVDVRTSAWQRQFLRHALDLRLRGLDMDLDLALDGGGRLSAEDCWMGGLGSRSYFFRRRRPRTRFFLIRRLRYATRQFGFLWIRYLALHRLPSDTLQAPWTLSYCEIFGVDVRTLVGFLRHALDLRSGFLVSQEILCRRANV